MHSEVCHTPPTNAHKFGNATSRKARNLLQSDEQCQEHLSVICAKFLRLQVAQISA